MFSAVGLLGAVAGSALVLWGAAVRRAMERERPARVAVRRMPGGAAQEAS